MQFFMSQEGAIQAVRGEKQGGSVNSISSVHTCSGSAIWSPALGMHVITETLKRQTEGGARGNELSGIGPHRRLHEMVKTTVNSERQHEFSCELDSLSLGKAKAG